MQTPESGLLKFIKMNGLHRNNDRPSCNAGIKKFVQSSINKIFRSICSRFNGSRRVTCFVVIIMFGESRKILVVCLGGFMFSLIRPVAQTVEFILGNYHSRHCIPFHHLQTGRNITVIKGDQFSKLPVTGRMNCWRYRVNRNAN